LTATQQLHAIDGDPAPQKGACLLWPNGGPSQLLLNSCTNRVVNTWNSLPKSVVSANIYMFKTRLDKFWHSQDIVCNFSAQL